MRIAVFGATGGTGKAFVQQVLEMGHEIKALVRTPSKLSAIQSPHLNIIEGNVLAANDISQTIQDTDVVVVSLGTTSNNPDNVVSEGTRLIIEQMQQHNIGRLLVVTSLGVGDSKNQVPFFFKVLMKTALKKVIADKNLQEEYVQESGLNWTIIRPGGLTDGPLNHEYKVGTGSDIQAGQISRANVADFMLRELENNQYLHVAVAIT